MLIYPKVGISREGTALPCFKVHDVVAHSAAPKGQRCLPRLLQHIQINTKAGISLFSTRYGLKAQIQRNAPAYKLHGIGHMGQHTALGGNFIMRNKLVQQIEKPGNVLQTVRRRVDANDRITSFLEKPADPPGTPEDPDVTLASMGIYVFKWSFLRDLLLADMEDPNSSHDFGNDLIPAIVKNGKAQAHRFTDSCVRSSLDAPAYWRDVGTVDAFWKANIDLTDFTPDLDLWDRDWPIWTYSESVPPAKFIHDEPERRGHAVSSMVSGGCIISGTDIRQSLLFTQVKTNSFASLDGAVVLPYVNVARHARLKNVVIDRGVHIPEGLVVGEDPAEDAKWFRVTEGGITLITQEMLNRREASL